MAKTLDVDLTSVGLPGEYVRIKDPKFLTWGDTKALTAQFNKDDRNAEEAETMYLGLITSWHVSAGDDSGDVFDGTPTREQFQRIPNIVLEAVAFKVKQRMESPLPPA